MEKSLCQSCRLSCICKHKEDLEALMVSMQEKTRQLNNQFEIFSVKSTLTCHYYQNEHGGSR